MIEQKAALSALNTNSSNQLMKFRELEMNHSKQLLRLGKNHNSTTAEIIIAITVYPSSGGKVSSTIMKFDDIQYSVDITNLSAYKTTGKFTCEHEGLYMISASVMSHTPGADYYISLNGNYISQTDIDHSSNDGELKDRIGAVTLTRKLNLNDQVWLGTIAYLWLLKFS
ncbi:unnamed protein product [Mytilus coruscus]|uniref:C1q domain-containing protein n=1 Tax=Mytilus coruscus TaxID=42192 RepID=A0A6J8C261_MYTCO|nr:unnamed protein product [Mytilus coruscus]